jgi:hypothetical protein
MVEDAQVSVRLSVFVAKLRLVESSPCADDCSVTFYVSVGM